MRNITRSTVCGTAFLTLAVGILVLAGSTMLSSTPADAYGARHAFCIQGDEYPGLSACTFDTYAQCLASASGRNLACISNPFFGSESDDPYAYQNRARPFPQSYVPYPPNAYQYR